MKNLILIISLLITMVGYSQSTKIIYKTHNGKIIGWVDILVDTTNYTLKSNEVFGDKFKKPLFENGVIVESWTQLDQDKIDIINEQRLLDSDISSIKVSNYSKDGKIEYKRIWDIIMRLYDENDLSKPHLTENQFNIISSLLYDAITPLKDGLWKIAKSRIDDLPNGTGILETIRLKVKEIIDNYITKNY